MDGKQGALEWNKFTKKTMPRDGEAYQILVCRDFGHDPFFTIVVVDCGMYTHNNYKGITEFIPERRDRWSYLPFPEGAVS